MILIIIDKHMEKIDEKTINLEDIDISDIFDKRLVVHNDDVNTFENVIGALIDVCGHNMSQAEQLTLIVHTKGRATVKEGNSDKLKPMKDAITDRGIKATIE